MSIDPKATLKIIGLEEGCKDVTVTAQFNPKELGVEKSVPWQPQKKKGPNDLEYTGGQPRTMSFELLFDGFETNKSIQPQINDLNKLSDMDPKLKRPTKVKIIWGENTDSKNLPKFEAVIASLSVKYTMFSPDGDLLRATANVKLTEAADLKVGKKT